MFFRQMFDAESWTYTYLLADEQTKEAVIIDPVSSRLERDLEVLNQLGLTLTYTLDTHVHADHITASGQLRSKTKAKSGASELAAIPCVNLPLKHNEKIAFGSYEIETRYTPGHTAGCVSYVVQDQNEVYAFTGDALLIRGCGRTDFQQGDARTLFASVHRELSSLPDHTRVFPAHDYKGRTQSTIGEEKTYNPRLKIGIDEYEFNAIMSALNLPEPAMMDVALPANMACGFAPYDAGTAPFGELTPQEVDDPNNYKIIDVRWPEEFDGPLGHISTAELVPLPELEDRCEAWKQEQKLLLVCRSGNRSSTGCAMLIAKGFTDVFNLKGGMVAWQTHHSSKEGA